MVWKEGGGALFASLFFLPLGVGGVALALVNDEYVEALLGQLGGVTLANS